jgi:hypothetical protein
MYEQRLGTDMHVYIYNLKYSTPSVNALCELSFGFLRLQNTNTNISEVEWKD